MRLFIDCLIYKRNKAFGYQEYLFNLLTYLNAHHFLLEAEDIFLVIAKGQEEDFREYDAFKIKSLKVRSKIEHIFQQQFLKYTLNIREQDVLLSTYNYSSFIKPCKSILVIHDLLFKRKEYLPDKMIRIQRELSMPYSIRFADKIIAISRFTANDIAKHYQHAFPKIEIIYNHFNFNKFSCTHEFKGLKGLTGKKFVLSVSMMAKHKNIITLLKSFDLLSSDNREMNLVIVGNPATMMQEERDFYTNISGVKKEKIFFFHGISNGDLGFLYRNCECFVSTSLFEGLGMPVVEALYFKTPLILSDIDVFHELTQDHATFFNPFDYMDLYEILLNKKYHTVPDSIREKILAKFSDENTSLKYIELINSFK